MSTPTDASDHANSLCVWDPFVRIFHWTLAAGFFVAYLSEDVLLLHVWTGYVLGLLVAMRIIWGLVGPQHARFSDFAFPPKVVLAYLFDLARLKAVRHLGHSPAGAVMVWALLAGVLAIVGSGLVLYAFEEQAGPLAGLVSRDKVSPTASPLALISPAQADDDAEGEHDEYGPPALAREAGEHEGGEELWEELHEALANLTLVLVFLHIGGVLFASVVTRENLPRSMVTGRKRPLDR